MKTIKPGTKEHRAFAVDRAAINETTRTVELAFSSEAPYERFWGIEILDHTPSSVDLTRLKSGGPLLMDHDSRDHIGVIESVQIGVDRVGRAVVRFGKSARAEEVYQDVKDGIRSNVSVGYMINKAVLVETGEADDDTYRVTDWTPFEVSLVSVPADFSVGVGRSAEELQALNPIIELQNQGQNKMSDTKIETVDVAGAEARGAANLQARMAEIISIGEQYKATDLAAEYVRSGKSVDEFKSALLARQATNPIPTAEIGLTKEEAKQFSFVRALNALSNPADRKAQEAAKFERECSDAYGSSLGRSAQGFYVPVEVQQRDLNVTTTTAGGHTVATNLLAASFIDLLRNRMQVARMGAQFLTGLSGQIAIPRQTGGATAYWVAESGAPTESQQAFDQVAMSPKTVGAFTDISRKLLLQSSIDVESFVRSDLATVLALAIDSAAINGTGASNQPTGILATAGIGDVAGGTNGLAPTWAHIVELWSDLAVANADFGALGILSNSKVHGKLMGTLKAAGVAGYIAEQFPDAAGISNYGGIRAGVSNQVPSNLTKGTSSGVCSALIAGNWNDLLIGQWGTLDLMVDPYTGSTSGTVRIVALQDVDIAVRHAESFSAMKDALTV
ncbi:MAG: phage major capsid protein [Sulfuritalea sp.]|nr:phage major capsid protein [Sulfuritalea sp.]